MNHRRLHLSADGPAAWLAAHVCTHLTDADRGAAASTDAVTGWIRDHFERAVAANDARAFAATQLVAGFGGTVAMELGYAFAGAGAAFLPEPDATRWVLGDGWVDGIVFAPGTTAAVTADHPWADRDDVRVVDGDELCRLAVGAVLAIATPIVEYVAEVTRAGRAGLWHEVGDALPDVLTWAGYFPVTPELVGDFTAMLHAPGTPWKRPARLELVDEGWGPVCVKHRGGCCMEYLVRRDHDPGAADEAQAAFRRAFPVTDPARVYCDNCKFLDFDETRDRQLWWRRRAVLDEAGS